MTELDIVIPVYNEGANIAAVLDTLKAKVKTPFRLLVVYDRDDDDTLPVLKGCKAPFEIVPVKNRGAGAFEAVMTGFAKSTAEAVLLFPADDVTNAGMLDTLFAKIKDGCDLACASRFMPGGAMIGCPWLKALLVRGSAWALHTFAGVPTRDPSNGFRMFSRRALRDIVIESTQGFTYSIELLVKCQRLGWRVAEVPAVWIERGKGQSRFRVIKWLPAYLRWFFYAFATSWLGRGPQTVRLRTT